MILKVLGAVVATIVLITGGIFAYAYKQPADYMIARQLDIRATSEVLFPYINSAKKSNEWMPWIDSDSKIQMTFTGPDEGVGSTASWRSEGRMGQGKSEIVESVPNQITRIKITYLKPMEMSQISEMSLKPNEAGLTTVRWAVKGQNNLMGRVMAVFMDIDKMVGGQFENGLQKLKLLAEKS